MNIVCARLKEVMRLKTTFINMYGEQSLIDDFNTVERMKEEYAIKVYQYRNRRNSEQETNH